MGNMGPAVETGQVNGRDNGPQLRIFKFKFKFKFKNNDNNSQIIKKYCSSASVTSLMPILQMKN